MKITIPKKFVCAYALQLIVPVLLVCEVFLHQLEIKQIETALQNLNAIASIQKARLQEMVYANYQRILGLTSQTILKQNLTAFLQGGDASALVAMKNILKDTQQPFVDVQEIFILDQSGKLFVSTNDANEGLSPIDQRTFKNGHDRLTLTPYEAKAIKLVLMGPIFDGESQLGVAGMIIDNRTLVRIVEDYSGLGQTGETVVVRKNEQGEAEFLLSSRDRTHPENMANVPQYQLGRAVTQALFRYEGLLRHTMDYRGQPVFAATRFLLEEEWGIVVKIDQTEVLRPIAQLRWFAYILLTAVVLFWLVVMPLWIQWLAKIKSARASLDL